MTKPHLIVFYSIFYEDKKLPDSCPPYFSYDFIKQAKRYCAIS